MIKEDYISFETAKLLKEKGFDDEYTNAFYDKNGNLYFIDLLSDFPEYPDNDTDIAASTLYVAMKWLREVHNLFIEIQYATAFIFQPRTTIYFRIFYMSLDYNTSGKDMLPDDYVREYYTSYEEACEAAIKYCLENLI